MDVAEEEGEAVVIEVDTEVASEAEEAGTVRIAVVEGKHTYVPKTTVSAVVSSWVHHVGDVPAASETAKLNSRVFLPLMTLVFPLLLDCKFGIMYPH